MLALKRSDFTLNLLGKMFYTKLCWLPLWWEAAIWPDVHNIFPFATVTLLCFKNVHLITFISSKSFGFPYMMSPISYRSVGLVSVCSAVSLTFISYYRKNPPPPPDSPLLMAIPALTVLSW